MRQNLLNLYEIQQLDLSIRKQQQARDDIPQKLRKSEQLFGQLKQGEAQLQQQQDATEREARALQTTLETERDKIRKWEARLGELRNQREYQALHRETEGQRRANRDNEEKLQELYKKQQEQGEQAEELAKKLAEAEQEVEAERTKVAGELAKMDEVLLAQQARRKALVPKVAAPLFRKYDTIRSRRMGQGLCAVTDGCCVGCNMRLPPQLYNILQRGDTAEQCPSCHRIIYWDQIMAERTGEVQTQAQDAEPVHPG